MNNGLYIHIPFCKSKCLYCDFYSRCGGDNLLVDYTAALIKEMQTRKMELKQAVSSTYIGGGTPSLMPVNLLKQIVDAINENFTLSSDVEFTIEVNPDDITDEYCEAISSLGINRVSMGVQSFVDNELKRIGRRHTAQDAERAFRILRKYFRNISIDLIFALPDQTLKSWNETIDKAIKLKPEHISAYALMYEEGTVLTKMRDIGKLKPTDDNIYADMYNMLASLMHEAGYGHYEISNFSLPGYESRHNSSYWQSQPYLGLGPAAHSYDGDKIRR